MKYIVNSFPHTFPMNFNSDPVAARDTFWDNGLGSVMASFLGVFGLLIVVYAILRTIKKVAEGKIGEALKGVVGAAIIAVFMFQPTLINTTIESLTGVVNSALETISGIGDTGGGGVDNGGGGGGTDTGGDTTDTLFAPEN